MDMDCYMSFLCNRKLIIGLKIRGDTYFQVILKTRGVFGVHGKLNQEFFVIPKLDLSVPVRSKVYNSD